MRRVVISGAGVTSPVGLTVDAFWRAIVDGRSGIADMRLVPTARLNVKHAAEVVDFVAQAHFDARRMQLLDRVSQLAVASARQALADADFELTEELARETPVIVGSAVAGQQTIEDTYVRLYGMNRERVHPTVVPRVLHSAPASQVSIDAGLMGPTYSIASACASSTHAIGLAFQMIRAGTAPIAVAGGAESCLTVATIKAWESLRALSHDTCRPFSRDRSGIVLGEGSAMLVLEDREHALARGARPYAEIVGFGMSSDAGEMLAPNTEGAVIAMQRALRDARLDAESIDYLNAHGAATRISDISETRAIHRVFGARAAGLQISSSKAVLGHSLGASGALETLVAALALRDDIAPPTAHYRESDPECDLDYVPNVARAARLRYAMKNSFAFGGLNAVLVLGKPL
ncbi:MULTISPECIES: beta-ketoacyl synthase [unclassified Burkholderia]|uniref:beta-ketoacyl-[acyl-carrier-protein] synthase family protein n=1 Tax=unclassified Burkholderia TaxID=2613784 RepID=UPI000F5859F2|nr:MULTISPECIES: beta-ketoacyl-[acyl-carrier-protein] synthase family protein [unclassified Burkholderia]RQR70568.1 beta-ketoacyl-[acyl-carrier-protein] synthase family protein [Burkholderia sp. Bp9012]RQR77845.1 beta-ketoacyl-[acyl-carrier-protein] synthase family protein [Burkholderia sp. Bp9011]RQR87841.1 beta-ketoacyl-[acyl-carrier-protein] synthase family protein [Burkholderia sp. Bp9010]RQZ43781.1 beta-ketoacyl-[acyl-carrier-protein] synthase family protein [Burkholderia sp. Bp9099]